jgi:hypothetical protein
MTSVDGRKVTYKPVSRMLSGEKTKLRTRFQSTVIKKRPSSNQRSSPSKHGEDNTSTGM